MVLAPTTSLGKVHKRLLPLVCFEPVIHDLWVLLLFIYTCTWRQIYQFLLCPWKTQIFQRRAPDLYSGGCNSQSTLGTQLWLNIGNWLQTPLNLFGNPAVRLPNQYSKLLAYIKASGSSAVFTFVFYATKCGLHTFTFDNLKLHAWFMQFAQLPPKALQLTCILIIIFFSF